MKAYMQTKLPTKEKREMRKNSKDSLCSPSPPAPAPITPLARAWWGLGLGLRIGLGLGLGLGFGCARLAVLIARAIGEEQVVQP